MRRSAQAQARQARPAMPQRPLQRPAQQAYSLDLAPYKSLADWGPEHERFQLATAGDFVSDPAVQSSFKSRIANALVGLLQPAGLVPKVKGVFCDPTASSQTVFEFTAPLAQRDAVFAILGGLVNIGGDIFTVRTSAGHTRRWLRALKVPANWGPQVVAAVLRDIFNIVVVDATVDFVADSAAPRADAVLVQLQAPWSVFKQLQTHGLSVAFRNDASPHCAPPAFSADLAFHLLPDEPKQQHQQHQQQGQPQPRSSQPPDVAAGVAAGAAAPSVQPASELARTPTSQQQAPPPPAPRQPDASTPAPPPPPAGGPAPAAPALAAASPSPQRLTKAAIQQRQQQHKQAPPSSTTQQHGEAQQPAGNTSLVPLPAGTSQQQQQQQQQLQLSTIVQQDTPLTPSKRGRDLNGGGSSGSTACTAVTASRQLTFSEAAHGALRGLSGVPLGSLTPEHVREWASGLNAIATQRVQDGGQRAALPLMEELKANISAAIAAYGVTAPNSISSVLKILEAVPAGGGKRRKTAYTYVVAALTELAGAA
jgi:hypothetical protein